MKTKQEDQRKKEPKRYWIDIDSGVLMVQGLEIKSK